MDPAAIPAIPLLLSAIADTNADRYLRANAAGALGMIEAKPELVVPALIKCLRDAEPGVRNNAGLAFPGLKAMRRWRSPALVDLLKDRDTDVKTRARTGSQNNRPRSRRRGGHQMNAATSCKPSLCRESGRGWPGTRVNAQSRRFVKS